MLIVNHTRSKKKKPPIHNRICRKAMVYIFSLLANITSKHIHIFNLKLFEIAKPNKICLNDKHRKTNNQKINHRESCNQDDMLV